MVAIEQKREVTQTTGPSLVEIIQSEDYQKFVKPWKDNPEMMKVVYDLTAHLYAQKMHAISDEDFDKKLDTVLDGEFGPMLIEDNRFLGNGVHSLRLLIEGKPLVYRESTVRGVSDKSGKK